MTIDEAIKHAEEVAEENEKFCYKKGGKGGYFNEDTDWNNAKCAAEHRQLAEWLKELKQLREQTTWIPVSERLPDDSSEYLVTVIDEDVDTYKYTGIAWYAHPKDYDIEEGDWRELMHDEKVIAWMPLPTPYEPKESEEV